MLNGKSSDTDRAPGAASGVTWSDIGLALFISVCLSLAIAAFAGMRLPALPDSFKSIHVSTILTGVGLGGAAIISLLNRRVPVPLLGAVAALCIIFLAAIFWSQPMRPIPPEQWATTEGIGSTLHSEWNVTFDGEPFDCPPVTGIPVHSFTCRAFGWGLFRAIDRYHAGQDNTCTFIVQLSEPNGKEYKGTYHCHNGGPYPFTAISSH